MTVSTSVSELQSVLAFDKSSTQASLTLSAFFAALLALFEDVVVEDPAHSASLASLFEDVVVEGLVHLALLAAVLVFFAAVAFSAAFFAAF